MSHILFATLGSLGDLHPFLALGSTLADRGHQVTVATSIEYRERVEGAGLAFRNMRPGMPDPSVYVDLMDRRHGPENIVRQLITEIGSSYQDLESASGDVDAIISSQVAMAAPLVAETRKLPWASAVLQPMCLMSAFDFPVLPQMRRLSAMLHALGPLAGRPLIAAVRRYTEHWGDPIDALRDRLGLPVSDRHTLLDDQLSDQLVLAMFPSLLARMQPDWPAQTEITGAAFWDHASTSAEGNASLIEFLKAGPAPVVFTLGSAAVHAAGHFYRESFRAAASLGCRAIFLTGNDFANRAQLPRPLPSHMLALPYASHREVFRAASVVVHQGGIGTLSQALRAGKPMLVVPFSHDQPDNAIRAERLGVARVIFANEYKASRAIRELEALQNDFALIEKAASVGQVVSGEHGASKAADAVERWLMRARPARRH